MKLSFFIITLLLIGIVDGYSSDFSFQSGLGYDYISQEYFIDSSANASDSLYTSFILQNTYLDDFKGYISGTYAPDNGRKLHFNSKLEQSRDFFRFKSTFDLNTKIQNNRYYHTTEIDYRARSRTSAEGDGYFFGYHRSRLIMPVTNSLSASFSLKGELISFDSTAALNYNYYRVGGKIGLEKSFGLFSYGDIHLTYLTRQVEDSTSQNYKNLGLESHFSGFYRIGDIDLFGRFEHKDYDRTDNYYDYHRLQFYGHNRFKHSHHFFTRQKLEVELTNFSDSDLVYTDYSEITGSFLAGYYADFGSLSAGLHGQNFNELNEDSDFTEDYSELGFEVDGDIFLIDLILSSFESITGKRTYGSESDLYTDYTFERINLFSDITISSNIHFTFLFSAEWEWHKLASNNSTIYLLSTNLSYSL